MRLSIEAVLDYHMEEPVDVLLTIEAAPLPDQIIIEDSLTVEGSGPLRTVAGEDDIGRRTWMHAEGSWRATYRGVFDVTRDVPALETLKVAHRRDLPAEVIPYLWPSRYCESDQFGTFAEREFGEYEGGEKVQAIADWIYEHTDYIRGSSDSTTTAKDTFVERQGVCRDFAHLMATLSRASGIPARVVSAYAWQLDPPDFHAVVEVYLEKGWHLVDATRLAPVEGLVRMAVGRDALDIAFMTVFGGCQLIEQRVSVERLD
ncbi:transglutaminase-like domain-containing protein [Sphingomonas solaris]|uniref:Transglutaminase family protein n=1 Tax=Alterirhizorhabdus solaris TaxID=2529389 RepID=A0A558QZR2_9SPHN|nr:transglutaminase family protein [Sphingomonas solaris]TVV72630.1 transglutaminase family protein [Sphingomonas solaris]